MGGITAVACSDRRRATALRQTLTGRGYQAAILEWPPGDLSVGPLSSGDGIVVVDGLLPGTALRAIANAVEIRPHTGIVAVGPTEPNIEVLIGLASGISSYLPTGSSPEAVADAVETLDAGGVTLPRTVSLPLVARLHNNELGIAVSPTDGDGTALTQREWQVLVLARQAYTTAEIAKRLVVSKATVRTHLAALARKFGVPGRAALAGPLTSHSLDKGQRHATFGNQLKSA